LFLCLAFAGPASAATTTITPTCGATLTASPGDTLQLGGDVGPCGAASGTDGALTIKSSGTSSSAYVTLDLNGHKVFGCPTPVGACSGPFVTGEGPGIVIDRKDYVKITDGSNAKTGTVSDFDTGIVLRGGQRNVIENINVKNNVTTAATTSDYGEGIGIYAYLNGTTWEGSANNVVRANRVEGNGPYGGIALYNFDDTKPGSEGPVCTNPPAATNTNSNIIGGSTSADGNVVKDNSVAPTGTTYQDDGIRIEPRVCKTTVQNNQVSGSSLEGIAVFADAWDTNVLNNVVQANGSPPPPTQRKGDGIRVFLRAARTSVHNNVVCANAGSGISVDSSTTYPATTPSDQRSTIQANASGTGAVPGTGSPCAANAVGPNSPTRPAYDLLESGHTAATETCRHLWSGDSAGTAGAFPACTAPAGGGGGAGPGATGTGSATTPATGGTQNGVKSPIGSALESDSRRVSDLRSCLAGVASHAKAEQALARRGSARKRKRAKSHMKRHARSGRQHCLRLYGRAPGAITALQARAVSQTKIELSFRAAGTHGSRPPAARAYLVKQSPRAIRGARSFRRAHPLCSGSCRFSVTRVGAKVTLTVTGLHPNTTYYYVIAARDNVSSRLGPRSRTVKATTG